METKSISPNRRDLLVLIVLGLLAAAFRLAYPGSIYLGVHAARDIYRAYVFVHHGLLPWFGPELNYGGRTLGPALYLLLAPPQLISPSPVVTYLYVALLGSLAPPLVYWIGRRVLAWPFAALAGFLAAVNPMACVSLRYLWNPVFLFPLSALLLLQTLRTRERPTRINWALFTLVSMVGMQVHFSIGLVALAGLVSIAWGRWKDFLRRKAPVVAAVLLLTLLPAMIGFLVAPASFSDTWRTPETVRPGWSKIGFNYHALRAAGMLVSPDIGDIGYRYGSTHFRYLVLVSASMKRGLTRFSVDSMNITAKAARLVAAFGFFVAAAYAFGPLFRKRLPAGLAPPPPGAPSPPASQWLIIVLWIAVPVAVLAWYNPIDWLALGVTQFAPNHVPPSYLPKRYLYQIFPALFLCEGLAVQTLWRKRIRWPLTVVVAWIVVSQGLLVRSWLVTAHDTGYCFVQGDLAAKIPTYRRVERLCRDLCDKAHLGRRDIALDRIRPQSEFGMVDMELELDYPLRLALRSAPDVGDVRDQEVVLILRRTPIPPSLHPRRAFRSGDYRVLIVPREEADRAGIKPKNWYGPYFYPDGKTGIFDQAGMEGARERAPVPPGPGAPASP